MKKSRLRSVSDKKRRSDKEYAKMRKLAYERDDGMCVLCGAQATETHHIIFRSHGGTNDLKNIACLCRKCHEIAHGVSAKQTRETLQRIVKERNERYGEA